MARRGPKRGEDRTGGLVLWKPVGLTSRRIVDRAQRMLSVRGLGHTGTLDPLACGIVVLVGGQARKFQELLTRQSKRYEARIEFGVESESEDAEGPLWCRVPRPAPPSCEEIERALGALTGAVPQRPPRFSAIKVGGERSHRLARAGRGEELKERDAFLERATIVDYRPPRVDIELDCDSGYYVRSFARDLGLSVGTGAYLTRLRRTRVGSFEAPDATALHAIGPSSWKSLEELLAAFEKLEVPAEVADRLGQGQRVDFDVPENFVGSSHVICTTNGIVRGLATAERGQLAPRRWLATDNPS